MELEQTLKFILKNNLSENKAVLHSVLKSYASSAEENKINEVMTYVLETPHNTNYNVLKPLLLGLSGGGGGGDDSDLVGTGKVGFMKLKG